ncbi:unnamed protein product, partial [Allacma fusca]
TVIDSVKGTPAYSECCQQAKWDLAGKNNDADRQSS